MDMRELTRFYELYREVRKRMTAAKAAELLGFRDRYYLSRIPSYYKRNKLSDVGLARINTKLERLIKLYDQLRI